MQKNSPVPPDDSHVKAEAIRSLPDETLCVVFDVGADHPWSVRKARAPCFIRGNIPADSPCYWRGAMIWA